MSEGKKPAKKPAAEKCNCWPMLQDDNKTTLLLRGPNGPCRIHHPHLFPPKWQYHIEESKATNVGLANELGKKGWEMICYDAGYMWFKRKIVK